MQRTQFTAFYPSKPYFAVSKVDLDDTENIGKFHDLMAEEVFSEGNEDFALKVCRDGRILIRITRLEKDKDADDRFDIQEDVSRWGEYLDFLNTFYLLFDSALLEISRFNIFDLHEVTNRDAFRVSYEDGSWKSENIAAESITSKFQNARWLKNDGLFTPIKYQETMFGRHLVSIEAIKCVYEGFSKVVANPGSQNDLAKLAKSVAEYKVGNYETCIVLSWFITEAAIMRMWSDHLDKLNYSLQDKSKRICGDRKDILTGADFSASIVANVLELNEIIDLQLFKDIQKVRKSRNNIVHSLRKDSATVGIAVLAFNTAQTLTAKIWGIPVRINDGYSVSGF